MDKMTIAILLGLAILLGSLAGCQATPTATQAPVVTEELQSAPPAGQAYPGPVELVPFNPYPTPISGERIEWAEVPELLQGGKVVTVYQAFSLDVTLTLEDGSILVTTAPARDVIFDLVQQCGDPCVGIRLISEG